MKLVYCTDEGLLEDYLEQVLKEYSNFKVIKVFELEGFLKACEENEQTSLFSEKQLFLIYHSQIFYSSEKFKKQKRLLDSLLSSENEFFFIEKKEKTSTSKEVNDFLKKVEIVDIAMLNEKNIKAYIFNYLKKIKVDLKDELINLICLKLIPNALIIKQELNKLKNYENIDSKVIKNVISDYQNENIFKIIEYLFNKKIDKAIKMFDFLVDNKTEINTILSTMAFQIYQLSLVKELAISFQNNSFLISKKLKVQPFIINNQLRLINNITLNKLKFILHNIYQTDLKIKKNLLDKYLGTKALLLCLL